MKNAIEKVITFVSAIAVLAAIGGTFTYFNETSARKALAECKLADTDYPRLPTCMEARGWRFQNGPECGNQTGSLGWPQCYGWF